MSAHLCHNPNCGKPIPGHLVSHKSAWFALPKVLRDAIWREYWAGQEDDKRPTQAYLDALDACIKFWCDHKTQCRIDETTVSRRYVHQIARSE